MKKILQTFKKFLYDNTPHFVAFFVPVIILMTAYAAVDIFPFGDNSVLALDLGSQYISFFDYLRDVVSGKESIFYNLSGSLFGNFYGTFLYYLASPFNFIVLLFPRDCITEGILTMLLAKAGCAGLTMSLFLGKQRKYSEYTSVLFACMYALCGFTVANTINPMWLDAVAVLPLIIMGIERICQKRGFLLYTLSLFLAIIANYYTGYMLCGFSVLYFIYFIFFKKTDRVLQKSGFFALSSVCAFMLSGVVTLPVIMQYIGSDAAEANFTESFNIPDALLKLFPTIYDTQRYGGLPFIYCGLFALIFALVYFLSEKTLLREKISGGIFCGLLLFSMYFKPLDDLWHGGRPTVWFDHRYSFLLIFLLIILGAEAFENIKNVKMKHIGSAFGILLAVLIISSGFRSRDFINAQYIVLFSVIFLAAAGAAAALMKKSTKAPARAVVFGLVIIELFANTRSYVSNINEDFGYLPREGYAPIIGEMRGNAEAIKANDSGFFRVEKTFNRAFNDNIASGIYGVSFSSSLTDEKVLKMLREMGFGQYDWHTRYIGATLFTDDILGIKYVMSKSDKLVPYSDKNGIVYENPDALPIAFLADGGMIESVVQAVSPFDYQQQLASLLSGEFEYIFTDIYDYFYSSDNVSRSQNKFSKLNSSSDGIIRYTVTMPQSGALYVYIPTTSEYPCGLYANGVYLRDYFGGFDYSTAYLGDYSEGERVNVELKLYYNETYFDEPNFCVLDRTALSAFTAKFPQNTVNKTGSRSFEITLNAERESALFTTIPYEKGWSAYIDGEKCEISTAVNSTLLCVRIPEGEHTVTLEFIPDGLSSGAVMTVCGAVLLVIIMLLSKRRRI